MNKKRIMLSILIAVICLGLVGVTYAAFTYSRIGTTNSKQIVGDIYMHYRESNGLTLENALPSSTYDSTKYFEFTIDGKNTYTKYDIWYDILLNRGDVPDGKQEVNRIQDKFIKFRLTEFIENDTTHEVEETEIFTNQSYNDLSSSKRIHVATIPKNTMSEITHRYRLYMWISNDVVIGNTGNSGIDYDMATWNNLFASIKVSSTGDFTEKELDEPMQSVNVMNTFGSIGGPSIKEIYFIKETRENIDARYDAASTKEDLTYNNEGSVKAWLEGDKLYVASDGKTYLSTGSSLFALGRFSEVTKIEFNNVDTSRVEDFGAMFHNLSKIKNLNLSSFNTLNATSMPSMFEGCSSLETLDLSSFYITNMNGYISNMFLNCSALQKIYVSSKWNASNQPDGMPIFTGCTSLTGGNGTTFDSNNVDKTMAIIDEGPDSEHPGYLTDIKDKP